LRGLLAKRHGALLLNCAFIRRAAEKNPKQHDGDDSSEMREEQRGGRSISVWSHEPWSLVRVWAREQKPPPSLPPLVERRTRT